MATTVNPSLKALVTLTEFAEYINQAYVDDQGDAYLRLINGVSLAIEKHCQTQIIKSALTEYYDGGRSKIILNHAPVDTTTGITFAVTENGTVLTKCVDGTLYDSDGDSPGYHLDAEAGIIERNGGTWYDARRIVKVEYTAGQGWQYKAANTKRTAVTDTLYSTDIPDDIREATLIILKAHTDLGPTSWGAQVLDSGNYIRPQAWPLAARLILDYYCRPRV